MISYTEALNIVTETAAQKMLPTENISLPDIAGRVCAQDIFAPLSIQPFDNAAMDGFAVRVNDLQNADHNTPVLLKKTTTIAAGDPVPDLALKAGECAAIMTGAPIPKGCDAVVVIEATKRGDNDMISFSAPAKSSENIRRAGSDFQKGKTILSAGAILGTQHILPLATLGIGSVPVCRRARVAVLATGRELVDDLSAPLQSGQIYNSNRPYLENILPSFGSDCVYAAAIADDSQAFLKSVQAAQDKGADVILSSGAVSAGQFDFVRASLESLGAEILFHKVSIKPGKPILFARLPNGTLYFGLPGNPVATAAGLRFFVAPALRMMTGQGGEAPIHAKLATPFRKKKDLRQFLKARLSLSEGGVVITDILEGQDSFMVSPFLTMNGWVVAPDGVEALAVGDSVAFYGLLPDQCFVSQTAHSSLPCFGQKNAVSASQN